MDLELKRKKPCLKKEIEALHALLAKLAEMEKVLHYRNQMIKGLSEEAADPEKPAWHIDAITLYRDGRKIIQVAYGIRRMAPALIVICLYAMSTAPVWCLSTLFFIRTRLKLIV